MIPWITCFAVMLALTPSSFPRCVVGGSAKGAAKDAVAVFSGKAFAQEFIKRSEGSGEIIAFRFEVDRVWKGKVPKEVLLYTHRVKAPNGLVSFLDEDFVPKEGERYLVFAYRGEGGTLTTQTCSRSKTLTEAEADIRELGIGHKPETKVIP